MISDRICHGCHQSYTPANYAQRYCAEECRIQASRARAVARNQAKRVHKCKACGIDLEPTSVIGKRKRYSRYCPPCKKKADLQRQKKWKEGDRARRKKEGICSRCDKPAVPGQASCELHLKKVVDWWRKRNGWKSLYDLTCQICEQPFQASRKFTKFCDGCKEEARRQKELRWREKNRPPTRHTLACRHCGEDYVAKRIDRMYCDGCKTKKPWLKRKQIAAKLAKEAEKKRIAKIKRQTEERRQLEERRLAAERRLIEEHRRAESQGYHCYALGQFKFCSQESPVDEFNWGEIEPTQANPGSEEKIKILQERVEKGLPLFHPEDRTHKMPNSVGFENWLWDDHPEPTVNSHMNPKEHEYA